METMEMAAPVTKNRIYFNVGNAYFDNERAREVFGTIDQLWKEQKGIFREEFLPQNQVAHPQDPKERANWLLCSVITQRGGLLSERPFDMLNVLRGTCPEMFVPAKVRSWEEEDIRDAFIVAAKEYYGDQWEGKKAGSLNYKLGEHPKAWKHNMGVIDRCWGGDARNIFESSADFEEAFSRVDSRRNNGNGLIGMRRKIFALYTIWMQEQKLIHMFPAPIPVDFHALRVLFATEVIDIMTTGGKLCVSSEARWKALRGCLGLRVSEKLIDSVTMWSQEFMAESGFSHMRCNPAIWQLSRTLCARSLQHTARNNGMEYCTDQLAHGRWKQLWKQDRVPCVYCPIESLCKWVVPSAPYYRFGAIVLLASRQKHPSILPGLLSHDNVTGKYLKVRSQTAPRTSGNS